VPPIGVTTPPDLSVTAWDPLPGVEQDCDARIARDAAAIEPFAFEPCASGRPGCKMYVARWPRPEVPFRVAEASLGAVVRDGVPNIAMRRRFIHEQSNVFLITVGQLEGPNKLALFGNSRAGACLFSVGISSFGAAFTVSRSAHPSVAQLAFAPWDGLPTRRFTTVGLTLPLPWSFYPVVVGERVFMNLWDERSMTAGVVERGSTEVKVAKSSEPLFEAYQLQEAKTGVAFVGGPYPYAVFGMSGADEVHRIADPERGMTVLDMVSDMVGGVHLVWREANAIPPERDHYVLWAAAYRSSREAVEKRKVGELPRQVSSGRMIANAGVALIEYTPEKALLVRLSDGKGWLVPGEPGHQIVNPLWVDDDAVWLTTSTGAREQRDGILRVARETLGAPIERAGF
jgi:hypothetical protein